MEGDRLTDIVCRLGDRVADRDAAGEIRHVRGVIPTCVFDYDRVFHEGDYISAIPCGD